MKQVEGLNASQIKLLASIYAGMKGVANQNDVRAGFTSV